MSTETDSQPSHPLPATPDELLFFPACQPTENKIVEEVETTEQDALSLAKKEEEEEEEEIVRAENFPSQAMLASDTERETENKLTEPPAVEVKNIYETPVVDVPVENKGEVERDSVTVSYTNSSPEPVAGAINSQQVEQQVSESVAKEETEGPDVPSVEKEAQEQANMVGAPESSIEAIEEPHEQSEVLHVKESEAVLVKNVKDSGVSKEVDKPDPVVAEVDQKVEEQSEVSKAAEVVLKAEEQSDNSEQGRKNQ